MCLSSTHGGIPLWRRRLLTALTALASCDRCLHIDSSLAIRSRKRFWNFSRPSVDLLTLFLVLKTASFVICVARILNYCFLEEEGCYVFGKTLGFVTIAAITAGPSTTLPRISCREPWL